MSDMIKDKELRNFKKELEHLFTPKQVEQIARSVDFTQRKSKLKPEYFLQFCSFLGESMGTKSLTELCAQFSGLFGLQITTEGLNQRFDETAVDFLKKIFHSLLMTQVVTALPIVEKRLFNTIRIMDSTAFDLPSDYKKFEGPNGSGIKIQLEYELYQGIFRHLQVQNGKDNDSTYPASIQNDIETGDLFLRDLGYFSQRNLLTIAKNGGYFISRLKSDTNLYQKDEQGNWQKLNTMEIMDPLKPGEDIELTDVRIGAKKEDPLIARVVMTKLTEEQEQQRQAQLNIKNRKGKSTPSAQKHVSINMFATNIPQEMVGSEEIYSLYSLRWQIEILFKTWKSLFKIDEIKEMKQERFECHLYGTLIQIIVCSAAAFQCRRILYKEEQMEVSEYKSIDIVKEHLSIIFAMTKKGKLPRFFNRIYISIKTNGRKSRKQQKPTVFDILHIVHKQYVPEVA
ncbi:IS4 family transposase [Virgibacillus sp. NKC19-16]|uniref:IS4 family transposase n=1 Tax=Virgibacillus salidurans TaxID=2831673 RepID=UPI001F2F9719|nr:IS4 family transposase [Virgibacillus sp. NKC19-16]UJL45853.1 IS4 family transposase [Virgibacillus sp. NKC19-16]UJL46269.1 IS4 family transposase [Virgibacillus sp. NKC19-16]